MATQTQIGIETYRCPSCDGVLAAVHGSWSCTTCRYVPGHSAD